MIDHGVSAKRLLEFVSHSQLLDYALERAARERLKDWWIVGGVIRDSIWGMLEGQDPVSSIQDIDLIYYDPSDSSAEHDELIESRLIPIAGIPWSVKNQARMHVKSNDSPYVSSQEAVFCAPETLSTVCITRSANSKWVITSSFGYDDLLNKTFRPTPHYMSRHFFESYIDRLRNKGWMKRWPSARVLPW